MGRRVADGELTDATTVYFGGGTPSLLDSGHLVRILDAIPRAADAEVTVEANPDSVDLEKLRAYRDHGVTRVSLGVQSTQPHVLAALGRTHDRDNVARAVDAIGAVGMPSFNLDVIAGTPGESDADLDATVDDVLDLDPPHVSVYGLMVEPGTPLEKRIGEGAIAAPDPDAQADRYLRADRRLTAAGLDWYEVSNWARPATSAATTSATGPGRSAWRSAPPRTVTPGAPAGGTCRCPSGTSSASARASRRWPGRSRSRRPPRPPTASRCPSAPGPGCSSAGLDPAVVEELGAAGLVEARRDRVVLTPAGRLLATEVTLRLDPEPADARRSGPGTRYH